MDFIATFINVRDWAELVHAAAWPSVVFCALWMFRGSINRAIVNIIARIPLERTTSLKARGLAELKMARKTDERIAKKTNIPPGKLPDSSRSSESTEPQEDA